MNNPPVWKTYNIPEPTGNYQAAPVTPLKTMPTQAIPAIGAGLMGQDMSQPTQVSSGFQDMSQSHIPQSQPGILGRMANEATMGAIRGGIGGEAN